MEYTKEHPLRVFEAFAGIGAQSLALERLKHDFPDFDYKVIGISDVEMNALAAYRALHGDIPNYGDIGAEELFCKEMGRRKALIGSSGAAGTIWALRGWGCQVLPFSSPL